MSIIIGVFKSGFLESVRGILGQGGMEGHRMRVLYLRIYQPVRTSRMRHKVNFYAGFNGFELSVFLLLDWLPRLKSPVWPTFLLIAGRRIVEFIFLPKVMRNLNSFVQNLNSFHHVYYLTTVTVTPRVPLL